MGGWGSGCPACSLATRTHRHEIADFCPVSGAPSACIALKRSVTLSTILIIAMRRHGRRVLAMASRSGHRSDTAIKHATPNKNADSERAQDRVLNRALRDRLHDPLENPV